jgi:hypothetical protein
MVTLSFGGQAIVGYAEGTFINTSRTEDGFSFRVGSDGNVVRSRNRNRTGSVTVTLLPSSPSNDILSTLADEKGGLGVYPLFIKDLSGTTLVTAPSAWVRKMAEVAFAKEASEDREWVLDCDELVIHVGGLLL